MKKKNVRLLDTICYVSRSPIDVVDILGNKITIRHTFPYNPQSKTAPKTAMAWASRSFYDHKSRSMIDPGQPEILERKNDPFTITIIDLDVRSEGGRAYKVIDDANRCFDLREDQIVDVIKHTGIEAGGKINGTFVWGITASTTRLVLVGGDLYNDMLERVGLTNLPNDAFKFGHVYRKRDCSDHVFIGRVKVPRRNDVMYAFARLLQPLNHEQICDYANLRAEVRADDHSWYVYTYGDECHGGIALMSSPKFELDVGTNDSCVRLASRMRVNANVEYVYIDGQCRDLSERHWAAMHNHNVQRKPYDENFSYIMVSGRKFNVSPREIYFSECAISRKNFRDELIWQPDQDNATFFDHVI